MNFLYMLHSTGYEWPSRHYPTYDDQGHSNLRCQLNFLKYCIGKQMSIYIWWPNRIIWTIWSENFILKIFKISYSWENNLQHSQNLLGFAWWWLKYEQKVSLKFFSYETFKYLYTYTHAIIKVNHGSPPRVPDT